MSTSRLGLFAVAVVCLGFVPSFANAQLAPEIGYVYPPGGPAGKTIDVTLGGYDWTPDMQFFVHDRRIKFEIVGPPTEVLVPPPPYWFGAKARGEAWPLPREFPGKLTIPADVPPGVVKFQVANANGASKVGFFHVGNIAEVNEDPARKSPQVLPSLPMVVNGQIKLIEEVDRYEFTAAQAGPITIELIARQIDSPLHGLLKVVDDQGKSVVDLADAEGRDLAATFVARAGAKYTLSLHDLDYAGDFSYIYRLIISPGPRVVAAYPAAVQRGQKQTVEFVGVGIATGADQLESVKKEVTVPNLADAPFFTYQLETPSGLARPFNLLLADRPDQVEALAATETQVKELPTAITGCIESRFGSDRYVVSLKKGDKWKFEAQASELASQLDLDLAIIGPDGKELASMDDMTGTSVDPRLMFTAAADGDHTIVVTDRGGKSGNRGANYRFVIVPQPDEFTLTLPPVIAVPIGGTTKLAIKVARATGHRAAIHLSFAGLPEGVTVPESMTIPEAKNDLSVELKCADDVAVSAAYITITSTTKFGEPPPAPVRKPKPVPKGKTAPEPAEPAEPPPPMGYTVTQTSQPILTAVVMKPRVKITPEGLDDVRKVHRGSTFLAPLFIDRLEGYEGEITLEMTSKQQRHRQGLASAEFVVPADATKIDYPIFVPEWLETTKTSRIILNGVVKVPDPKGNMRTLVQKMAMRIGILPDGAMLKIATPTSEMEAKPGSEIPVTVTISRTSELREPIRLELIPHPHQVGLISAEPLTLNQDEREARLNVRFAADPKLSGEQSLQFRATALQGGKWQVVSEATLLVTISK